ncbi:MAG: hypothetical protein KDB18_13095, partial [Salinibacterium sp.]|nr:hypothetical protein [Salinibacterium sp.]
MPTLLLELAIQDAELGAVRRLIAGGGHAALRTRHDDLARQSNETFVHLAEGAYLAFMIVALETTQQVIRVDRLLEPGFDERTVDCGAQIFRLDLARLDGVDEFAQAPGFGFRPRQAPMAPVLQLTACVGQLAKERPLVA